LGCKSCWSFYITLIKPPKNSVKKATLTKWWK
jgi:hypothetical protein